jgi:hypothetical protein
VEESLTWAENEGTNAAKGSAVAVPDVHFGQTDEISSFQTPPLDNSPQLGLASLPLIPMEARLYPSGNGEFE